MEYPELKPFQVINADQTSLFYWKIPNMIYGEKDAKKILRVSLFVVEKQKKIQLDLGNHNCCIIAARQSLVWQECVSASDS